MSVPARSQLDVGSLVEVVTKADQPTGARTTGRVSAILTRSPTHPHGIKVRLEGGAVGRVQALLEE